MADIGATVNPTEPVLPQLSAWMSTQVLEDDLNETPKVNGAFAWQ